MANMLPDNAPVCTKRVVDIHGSSSKRGKCDRGHKPLRCSEGGYMKLLLFASGKLDLVRTGKVPSQRINRPRSKLLRLLR